MRKSKLITLITIAVAIAAQAEPQHKDKESHNYIIERQQAGQVTGVPTMRRIRGSREIDIYPNGLMFEKNSVVGVTGGK